MRITRHDFSAAIVKRLLTWRVFRFLAGVQVFKVAEVGAAGKTSSTLLPASNGVCSIPVYSNGGGIGKKLVRTFPHLRAWDIPNAGVSLNHRFSCVFQASELLISDRMEPPPFRVFRAGAAAYRTANIVGQSEDLVFVRKPTYYSRVETLLYVGTRATYNWSHFLIDFLPGLHIANRFGALPKHIPVVVPKSLLHADHFVELLRVVADGRKILAIGEDEVIEADRVIWVDPPAYGGPFTEHDELREPLVWHRDAMASYRDFLTSRVKPVLSPLDSSPSRRIYLTRPDGRRSPVVENLTTILKDYRFDTVDMAMLDLAEKIELMSTVTHVVSPAGSGLANVLFARPGVKVLAFTDNRAPSFDNFVPNLVDLVEGTLSIFAAKDRVTVASGERYELREDLIRAQLKAFVA